MIISETGPAPLWKYPVKAAFYPLELAGKSLGIDAGVIASREEESVPTVLRRSVMQIISPLGSRAKLDAEYGNDEFFTTNTLRRPITGNPFFEDIQASGWIDAAFNVGFVLMATESLLSMDPKYALAAGIYKLGYNLVTNAGTDVLNGLRRAINNPNPFRKNRA